MMNINRKFVIRIIFSLFILRCIVVWYGYDRLPLLSNNDEAGINDPAICMSKGYGLVSRGIEGAMGLEKVFSYYPPVYISFQSLIYKIFGLNTFTLRGPSIIFFCAYTLLLLLLFRKLRSIGVFDDFSTFWVSLFLLTDPTVLSYAHQGRCESLAILFAIAAFFVLVSQKGIIYFRRNWIVSAIFVGLSLSTHFEMATIYIVFSIFTVAIQWKRSKWFTVGLISIPLFVTALIFVAAHGGRTGEAISQLTIVEKAYHAPGNTFLSGFRVGAWIKAIFSKQIEQANLVGGFTMLLVCVAWICVAIRSLGCVVVNSEKNEYRRKTILLAGLFCCSNLLIIAMFMGSATQRVITILPVALFGMGVALSHLQVPRSSKKLLSICLAVIVLTGIGGNGIYFRKVYREWNERAPRRFEEYAKGFPKNSNIAAAFPWWYELNRLGHKVRMIGVGTPGAREYLVSSPEIVDNYDIIILFEGDLFIPETWLEERITETVTIGGKRFVVYYKIDNESGPLMRKNNDQ